MIFLNIRPLLEPTYTGIPQLTWHMARYWRQSRKAARFFIGNLEVAPSVVDALILKRTGRYLFSFRSLGYEFMRPLSEHVLSKSVAIFPHSRQYREKRFRREIHVIHDLTGILTSEFHPDESVQFDTKRFVTDIPQADRIVCVSAATRDDVLKYLKVDPTIVSVASPGVEWSDEHFSVYKSVNAAVFDPYVLILGTFEPRKNLEIVFEFLSSRPEILNEFIFCFCGSPGWGGVYDRVQNRPEIASAIKSGRVRIIPFVNERLKYALIKEASFMICPSYIEGFGSPVAECLSLGVPVVTSFGGSLPEVGGEAAYYFDPFDKVSLSIAIDKLMADEVSDLARVRRAAYEQGRKFTWENFNQTIDTLCDELMPGMAVSKSGRLQTESDGAVQDDLH